MKPNGKEDDWGQDHYEYTICWHENWPINTICEGRGFLSTSHSGIELAREIWVTKLGVGGQAPSPIYAPDFNNATVLWFHTLQCEQGMIVTQEALQTETYRTTWSRENCFVLMEKWVNLLCSKISTPVFIIYNLEWKICNTYVHRCK